ncbi:MAG: hypothetical protein NT015_12520 [Alphaproteobacteria bacterium]|nr:hypothetical protein [Alphaproteobacteria bacterium]
MEAYFDDAGTHDDADVVVWGGFLGNVEQWAKLDAAWRNRLAKPFDQPEHARPSLSRFHLSHCAALDGEFATYSRAESDSLQFEFRQIIASSGVVGVAYGIDRKAYDRLVIDPEARAFLGDAEQACFGSCFKGAFQQAQKYYPGEKAMALAFDWITNPVRKAKLADITSRVEQGPEGLPQIAGVFWGRSAKLTPLQAADVIATENYWAAQAFLAGRDLDQRPHMAHFLRNVDCLGYIMREQEIRSYMRKYGFAPPD